MKFVLLVDWGEPKFYGEATMDNHKYEWFKAIPEEIQFIHENLTYKLVDLPKGKRELKNKWMYKWKIEENNSWLRYKVRLGLKDLSKNKGIDFPEIFHPR